MAGTLTVLLYNITLFNTRRSVSEIIIREILDYVWKSENFSLLLILNIQNYSWENLERTTHLHMNRKKSIQNWKCWKSRKSKVLKIQKKQIRVPNCPNFKIKLIPHHSVEINLSVWYCCIEPHHCTYQPILILHYYIKVFSSFSKL